MSDQLNNQQRRYRSEYKPKNFNNRRGTFSNNSYNHHSKNQNIDESAAEQDAVGNTSYSASSSASRSSKFPHSSNPEDSRNSRRHYSSYQPKKFVQNNKSEQAYVNSELNPNAPSFISGNTNINSEQSHSSGQRGSIVSGRYIRKHSNYNSRPNTNQSENGRSDHSSNSSNDYTHNGKQRLYGSIVLETPRTYASNKYNADSTLNYEDAYPSNEHSNTHTHSGFNKRFPSENRPNFNTNFKNCDKAINSKLASSGFKRDCVATHAEASAYTSHDHLPYKLPSNSYYSNSSQSGSKKLNDSKYASSDVYHYSSQGVKDKKPSRNVNDFTGSKSSSILSSKGNEATQRELLIERLSKGDCECLVCCEQIRVKDQTWHCLSCYHVLHLRCIRKWARSPAAAVEDGSWRCPACQSLTSKVPYDYFCFCGNQKNPDVNYHLTPHSCGEICGRKRPECDHQCKELCHPGPCPACSVVIQKRCPCGKTFKTSPCKQSAEETCDSVCNKTLNCGVHPCKSKCHTGTCQPCEKTVDQECYCKKDTRSVSCTSSSATTLHYSCGGVCEKSLSCGNHKCDSICHSGECIPCSLSVDGVKSCSCGKSGIRTLIAAGRAAERTSCMDPIPVCGEICGKQLPCGPKDNPHSCQSLCHNGECPKCPLTTSLKCRCGAFTKEFECAGITSSFLYLCERRCTRRKDCGRHKCLNNCCVSAYHMCELICNKKLRCGNHLCQETCHIGNCPTCWNVSFDELRCHCGETVQYPPIQCGTKPPECTKPCIRSHPCGHDVKHTCHSDEKCPPCTSLTTKWCFGHHKQCGTVMCFLEGVSCGMLCQKKLPCGRHGCNRTCHAGECLKEDAKCVQLCNIPRPSCQHICGSPCHADECPDTPCKASVTLTCPCGHRSETTTCIDSTKAYRLMSVSVLATKMQEVNDGQCINLNDILGKKSKSQKLQCSEECAVLERNKRLAVALQIQNPELTTSPGPPNYSEFLKTEAKKNPAFVLDVYDRISDLVQLAKESKQKCRSHPFAPMNRDHRRVIHELAEFFGCETQSYDEEPKKSVVVTAYKNKCWLPFVSIMSVVQRDMGFRKGPAPVIAKNPSSGSIASSSGSQKKKIDYFDYNE